MTPTNYKRGFKRILLLIGIAWFGYWGIAISDVYFSEQHRKHYYYISTSDKSPTYAYATLGTSPEYRSSTVFSEMHDINGKRFFFFFQGNHADSTILKSKAEAWLAGLTEAEKSVIETNEMWSRRLATRDIALLPGLTTLGALLLCLLGWFIYRGFRPKGVVTK
jgi:hypothetical protein